MPNEVLLFSPLTGGKACGVEGRGRFAQGLTVRGRRHTGYCLIPNPQRGEPVTLDPHGSTAVSVDPGAQTTPSDAVFCEANNAIITLTPRTQHNPTEAG